MQKTQLFGAIADFYEYSMKLNCDYAKWAEYVVSVIDEYAGKSASGIDAACGSGYFTRAIKRAGHRVCGVDISAEMLTAAQKECGKERLAIDFRKEDMTKLKSFEKVDFITVVNDGMNCVSPDKFAKTIKSFASCLKKGGLLHFDISSEYKLKNVLGNETFCEDDDDYSYIWFNRAFDDRVEMDMSVFLRRGEFFVKEECTLTEYVYPCEFVKGVLAENGFELVSLDGQSGGPLTDESERICFTSIKK